MATLNPVPDDRPRERDEALLVARARAGEPGAIEEIVRGHQAWIYNLAVRMLQHPFDAEDATQEILVKALTRLSTFEGRNPANPCRCASKTRGFIRAGHVDPSNLLFAREHVRQVREVVRTNAEALSALDQQCGEIYRQHPFHESPDLVPAVRRLLESPTFQRATDVAPPPVPASAAAASSPP